MKHSRLVSATVLAAAAVLTFTGCAADPASPDSLRVTVVTPYLANAATKEVIDLFTAEGQSRGWTVDVVDTAGDMNELNSAFQNAAAQVPDAIVLGSGDPEQLSLGLSSASAAGVPVFAMDASPAEGIAANVTSDNADLGVQSANALIEAMGGSGSVVMLTHEPHPGVRARAEGARETFANAGITVLEEKHVNVPGPVDDARTSVQDLIASQGAAVNGIWGGWDEPALGATQALEAAGITDIPVVGVDGQDFARAEIEKGGPFKATVAQDWPAIATTTADLVQALVVDGTQPAQQEVQLPGVLVTKE